MLEDPCRAVSANRHRTTMSPQLIARDLDAFYYPLGPLDEVGFSHRQVNYVNRSPYLPAATG